MNRHLPLVVSALCCVLAVGQPPPCRSAAPPAAPPPPLAAAGQKLADNDIPGAIKGLQAVLQTQPNNADALHLLTIAYLHAAQPAQAAATAETTLQQTGLGPSARAADALLLGKARYSAFVDSFKHYSSTSCSLPNMQQLLGQMATHEYETSRNEVIVTQGDPTAQESYDNTEARLRDAIAQLQKSLKLIEDAYQQALDADPHLAGAHDGLGMVRAAEGYQGEARSEFMTELTEHGPNGIVYTHLGELDAQEGRPADAVAEFQRAVAFSPHLATPYEDLAELCAKQHDDERAQWARGMALLVRGDVPGAGKALAGAAPKSGEMLCAQAQYALTQKRQDDARRLLEKAHALAPDSAPILSTLGDLEEAQGDGDKAVATYKQALDADPACDSAWYGIGLIYDARGDKASAADDYRQALLVNPNNPLAKLNLAADEADLGQSAQAAADLRDYLQRFPTAGNFYVVQTTLAQLQTT